MSRRPVRPWPPWRAVVPLAPPGPAPDERCLSPAPATLVATDVDTGLLDRLAATIDAESVGRLLGDAGVLLAATFATRWTAQAYVKPHERSSGCDALVAEVALPDGRTAAAVFTDRRSLAAHLATRDDDTWAGVLQSGAQACRWSLQRHSGGIVLNPAGPGPSLALEPRLLAWSLRPDMGAPRV